MSKQTQFLSKTKETEAAVVSGVAKTLSLRSPFPPPLHSFSPSFDCLSCGVGAVVDGVGIQLSEVRMLC